MLLPWPWSRAPASHLARASDRDMSAPGAMTIWGEVPGTGKGAEGGNVKYTKTPTKILWALLHFH
jgi:hypothetical protein